MGKVTVIAPKPQKVKCIQRYYDKKGNVKGYIVQNQKGEVETLYPDTVKHQLRLKDSVLRPPTYEFVNLTITNDNRVRLVKDKTPSPFCYIESYTIHSFEMMIKDIENKALIFRSKVDPQKHLAKYKLMNVPVVQYKFYDDYLYLQTQQTVEFVSVKQIRFRNSNLRENMGLKPDGFFSKLDFKIIDISQVDTVEMTDMQSMFEHCKTQSVNLSTINTSNVTDMSNMFYGFGRKDTILNLSRFNTAKVKDFAFMFAYYQGNAGLNLSMFQTKQAEDFYGMFIYCQADSVNIKGFDYTNDKKDEDNDMFDCSRCKVIQ